MPNLLAEILPKLEKNRIQGMELAEPVIYPYYTGYSLANLPSSICRWLGVNNFGIGPLADEIQSVFPGTFRKVVLVVVDGWGLENFRPLLEAPSEDLLSFWKNLLPDALVAPLTSITPSTTAAALTTLWTGALPASHGVIGYEVFLKEYGLIANMISFSPATFSREPGLLRNAGFRPETFLPVPMLGSHLRANGITNYAFQHLSIARSGLSTMLLSDVTIMPYRTQGDLWTTMGNVLLARPDDSAYLYAYWGDIDELEHVYGPGDERIPNELESFTLHFSRFIRRMRKQSKGDTLVLVTADHGQAFTPPNPRYELVNHPELLEHLTMGPSIEARLAALFLRPGHEEAVRQYFQQTWPGKFSILTRQQVLESGLMGPGTYYSRFPDRLGDLLVVARDRAYLRWSEKENVLTGKHGGLSPQEMLIPLVGIIL